MRPIPCRLAPLALAACLLAAAPAASATSTSKQIKTAKASAIGYLTSLQQPSGAFETDWVLGALAAAGEAPADVKTSPGATDARTYYRELIGNPATWPPSAEPPVTEFERATLNAYAAGIDPARVSAGQNLIARIAARYQAAAPGYYGSASNFGGAVFGLLALAETRTRSGHLRVPQALLDSSIAVLRANQHHDGGWGFEKAEGNAKKLEEAAEPDETGAAMAALCSAGVPKSDSAIVKATAYLEADLVASSGAFNAPFGVNTDSNAWALQGLNACAIAAQGPGFTSAAGRTPIDFLISDQLPGGGLSYEPGEAEGNEYSTQDGLRSLSGAGFTAAPVAGKGEPKWVFDSSFASGVQSLLTLIINNGTSALKVCSVSIAPPAATTTLGAVLEASLTDSSPSGCVTSFAPASGSGAITQINSSPSPAAPKWDVSIDGAKEKQAKRATKIDLGDTISLHLS
jgi:hypothetical protein